MPIEGFETLNVLENDRLFRFCMSTGAAAVRKLKGVLEKGFRSSAGQKGGVRADPVNAVIENYYRAGNLRSLQELAEREIYSNDEAARARGIGALDRMVKIAERTDTVSEGRMVTQHFTGPSKRDIGYTVYLPPGYENSEERYPVVYLMHGFMLPINSPMVPKNSDDYWRKNFTANRLFDRLIASGAIKKTIVVMPDMGTAPIRSAGRNEDLIINNLIPHIDQNYRTIADRGHRAMDGYSLGARLSVGIASRNPEKFSSVGGHSGIYHGLKPKKTGGLHYYLSASFVDPLSAVESRRAVKDIRKRGGDVIYDQHRMMTASPPTPFHTYQMWRRGIGMSMVYHSMNFKRAERKN